MTKPQKIGIVCYPTYGGSGVLATELGIALAKKGYQIHFITYHQPVRLGFLNANIHFHRVHIEDYPLFKYPPYELALVTKMVEVVQEYSLEILHVHYAIPHAYAACMARQMLYEQGIKVKVVTTLHGTDINLIGNQPSYKKAVAYSIKNSDAITAVSESLKKETLSFFNTQLQINVIYNFISTKYDIIKQDCNKALIAKDNEKIITHISNFRPVKRVQDVLSIFEFIIKKISAKLLLVGEGPLMENIRRHAKKTGIYKKIVFFGNTNEMEKILCYSDLFLLPSETESFGLVALEAMAAGTPVISTNVGGLPEVNLHGKTGYLSPVGAVEEMAENSLKILTNPTLWEKFSKEAIAQSKKFNSKDIVKKYERVYEKVLSTN